jgi:phospholipase C
VPTLLISPFARRSHVAHGVYDHTSVLKLIEWRWQLASLTVRDATANNLALALDFGQPNYFAPLYAVPSGPFGGVCLSTAASNEAIAWAALQDLSRSSGFTLP